MEATAGIAILPQGIVYSKLVLQRNSAVVAIAAVDSISPPVVVRSDPYRASVPRALVRKIRRTRRRSVKGNDGEGEDEGLSGDGDDGAFGGGGRGGGKGWGSDGGDPEWDEDAERGMESSDPVFDFVYGIISFVALSNCTHFACKKIGRFMTNREIPIPIPIRLVQSIC